MTIRISRPFSVLYLSLLIVIAGTAVEVARGEQAGARAAVGIDVADAQKANEAELFVQASIDRGYQILNNKGLSQAERQAGFREFLNSITDTKRVALFTLGTYARNASKADVDRFMVAYDDFAAAMYQGYFDWYTGQSLRVANSVVRTQDDVVVYADVIGPNGAPQFKVGFRVRKDAAQKNIVTDFQFEGVWLALNQRSDFTSFLQQNKGDFTLLSAELQKRTQRFREAWAPPAQRQSKAPN
jgi:ABC-type transporter MlaC component